MQLRPYQSRTVERVFEEWQNNRSTLVVLPTGLGKTIVFTEIIRRCSPLRSLVIAHREELIRQAAEKITQITGLPCGVEMGSERVASGFFGVPTVVVSSIQTQTCGGKDSTGRMSKFKPEDFNYLIIDEAHHAASGSYKRLIDYYKQNPNLKVLGVTATPDRSDEAALGQVFDSVAMDYEVADAINDGWLVPISQQMVSVSSLDFSGVHTMAGDLNGAELAKVMEYEENLHGVCSPSIEIMQDKRTIVFCSSVDHAERMTEIYNRHKSGMAAVVSAKTPKQIRRQTLADFNAGKLQVVCNCGVLTEGFDSPGVEVIIMARPTKSRALYAQMIGRATRPLPFTVDGPPTAASRRKAIADSKKPKCLIVDFVGNSGRHKLVSTADILGGKYDDEVITLAKKKIAESEIEQPTEEALEAAYKEREKAKLLEACRRSRLQIRANYRTQQVNPFSVWELTPERERGWDRGKTLTEKQLALLQKQGINTDEMPYHQQRQLLNEMFRRFDENLCSYKQAKLLKDHGLKTDLTRQEATEAIRILSSNHWQNTYELLQKFGAEQ